MKYLTQEVAHMNTNVLILIQKYPIGPYISIILPLLLIPSWALVCQKNFARPPPEAARQAIGKRSAIDAQWQGPKKGSIAREI